MARSGDPMSGLLSGLGGIDPSLFQRPQAMKDMKSPFVSKATEVSKTSQPAATNTRQQGRQQPNSGFAMRPETQGASSDKKPAQRLGSSPNKDPFSDSHFSGLLGEGNFSKLGR